MDHHTDFDYPINPSSHNKTFLVPAANGIHNNDDNNCISAAEFGVSDIEMITLQAAAAYTSLKDLIPTTPTTPSSIMSPTNGSWREIPIKDPLLQHAAWAYLQPMAPDHDAAGRRNFVQKLKDQCCGIFGCFNEVVLVMVNSCFSFSAGAGRREEDDEEIENAAAERGEEDKS